MKKQKLRALKNYRKYNNDFSYDKVKFLIYKLKRLASIAYTNYLDNIQNQISSDPTRFGRLCGVNGELKKYRGVRHLKTFNNSQSIVDAFATCLSGVYLRSHSSTNIRTSVSSHSCINFMCVSRQEILAAIPRQKNKATAGIDMVPSFLVKDCTSVFVEPLYTGLYIFYNKIVIVIVTHAFSSFWELLSLGRYHTSYPYR